MYRHLWWAAQFRASASHSGEAFALYAKSVPHALADIHRVGGHPLHDRYA
jgi:hypothetical protein